MMVGDFRTEDPVHIVIDILPRFRSQVICRWIVLEVELRPNDQVHDLLVDTVRPIIVEDLDVGYRR